MAIDRGDAHLDDAGSWEAACRHIAIFLFWAAERGLASDDHDAADVRADPIAYFISHWTPSSPTKTSTKRVTRSPRRPTTSI